MPSRPASPFPSLLQVLRRHVRGPVTVPGDPGYDAARTLWNAMIDRRPAAIVRCTSAGDVAAALRAALDHGLPVAVRGGGHGVAGHALCDDGLVIDLSLMREVIPDPARRLVTVEGGATWRDVDEATVPLGFAVPAGIVSTTGVAGLTLGGGLGWLARAHGLACDNVVAMHVITASGTPVIASARSEPDLFWALRGGGGNFGIVTRFEFGLHPVPDQVLFGPIFHRLEPALLHGYREVAPQLPREASVYVDFLLAPPAPFLPDDVAGQPIIALVAAYVGDAAAGARALSQIIDLGRPLASLLAAMPYRAMQRFSDDLYGPGWRNYWTAHHLAALDAGAVDALVDVGRTLPTPQSDMLMFQVGGAVADAAPDATAYPHRATAYIASPGARWSDGAADGRCVAWVASTDRRLGPHATGAAYANFLGAASGREHAAYGIAYDRLAALKRRYDPDNVFRFNQNVAPSA